MEVEIDVDVQSTCRSSARTSSRRTGNRYDSRKHGWYHPLGRKYASALARDDQSRVKKTWAATIRKSKDHIGYGDGTIGYGDVQESAISKECPDYFVGARMVPGPKTNGGIFGNVHRFPGVSIQTAEDGSKPYMKFHTPVFLPGPNLSVIEMSPREYVEYQKSRPKIQPKIDFDKIWVAEKYRNVTNLEKNTLSDLIGTGCTVRDQRSLASKQLTATAQAISQTQWPRPRHTRHLPALNFIKVDANNKPRA